MLALFVSQLLIVDLTLSLGESGFTMGTITAKSLIMNMQKSQALG
jgi:hypothetical protein